MWKGTFEENVLFLDPSRKCTLFFENLLAFLLINLGLQSRNLSEYYLSPRPNISYHHMLLNLKEK